MYIRSVKFKNMFAYGNHEVFIPFDTDPETFWQVLGKNGVGKSSFIRIIKIGLYHELEGLKIDEVAHQINKNGLIEINVDNNGFNWLIQTTFSPYNIKVYKNGAEKPEDWGGKDDIKKRIRQEISTIPYHIFNNTISLSVNDFKSFLTMSPKDARDIRDRIFGFFIFNQMAEDFKKENSIYNKDFDILNNEINILNEQINNHIATRNEIVEKIKESKKDTIDLYNKEIEEFERLLLGKQEELAKKQNSLKILHAFLNVNFNKAMQKVMDDFNHDLDSIKQKYDLNSANSKLVSAEINQLINERNFVFNKQLEIEIENYEKNLVSIKEQKDYLDNQIKSNQIELDTWKTNSNIRTLKLSVNSLLDNIKLSFQSLKNYGDEKSSFDESLRSNLDTLKRLTESINFANTESAKLDIEKISLESKIKLFDSGKCGSCGSDLTTNDKIAEKQGFIDKIAEIDSKLNEYDAISKENMISKENVEKQIEKIRNDIAGNSNKINSEIDKLISYKKSLFDNVSKIESSIESYGIFSFIDLLKSKINESLDYTKDDLTTKFKYEIDEINYEDKIKELDAEIIKIKSEFDKQNNNLISTESFISSNKSKLKSVSEIDTDLLFDTDEEYNLNIKSKNELLKKLNSDCNSDKFDIENLQMEIIKCKQSMVSIPENILAAYGNSTELGKSNYNFQQREQAIKAKIENISTIINDNEFFVKEIKTKIENIKIQIQAISDEKNYETQLKSVDTIINNTRESINSKTLGLDAANKKILNNDMILYSLGDEGIKAFILKNIIPSINYEVSQYLQTLGIPLEVSFNELFEVTVKRFGIEANLKSISTGQTKMIDCCILLAITKILKMKYTDVNLVFYDEVFSSLDSDNRPIIIEMFYKVCCEILKMNVFMMGHFYVPIAHESKVIEIKSDTRFSELNVYTSDDYMKINA